MGTCGFADAKGKRTAAVAVDLIKCEAFSSMLLAGRLSLLVGLPSLVLQMVGIRPACISAVYDAATAKDVTGEVTRGKPMWSNTPVDISASDTEPTSVAQQDLHSAAELQKALVFVTSHVKASHKMSDVQGEARAKNGISARRKLRKTHGRPAAQALEMPGMPATQVHICYMICAQCKWEANRCFTRGPPTIQNWHVMQPCKRRLRTVQASSAFLFIYMSGRSYKRRWLCHYA